MAVGTVWGRRPGADGGGDGVGQGAHIVVIKWGVSPDVTCCCAPAILVMAYTPRGLTDESEILKFLQHGTLVGLLPVPHPILIRKYQANAGTAMWFRTYMWGVIYLRNMDPPIWYDTDVKLFEIQRV
ncbi:hypothetical protein GDO81_002950 [Engystomops pustulosus]|uniref:Uncharacterized protein n=1 Tax=Engystomops pustulosus TaxID=76066 RepID=A0AAV7DNX0_ENGPU|nr:hypothetical protein GDO81_002950 [Engystomops pustulosus]